MTLFEKFETSINNKLIEKLKILAEKSIGDTDASLHAIFHTLLAGLIRRANSDMSTGMLVTQISKIYDKEIKKISLAEVVDSEVELKNFVAIGDKYLSQLFPSFRSQLLSLVIKHCGTSKKETTLNIGFVNSLMIKFLAEEVKNGMNKEDLMNYLKEHRDSLFEIADEDYLEKMIPALGMEEMRDRKLVFTKSERPKEEVVEEVQEREDDVEYEEENQNYKKPLLIVAAIILAALIAYFVYDYREQLFNRAAPAESKSLAVEIDSTAIADSLALIAEKELLRDKSWEEIAALLQATNLAADNEVKIEAFAFSGDSIAMANVNLTIIDSLISVFERNPRFQIQLKGGHSGADRQIALRRAFFIKRLLQSKGVDPIKIDAVADRENLDYIKIKLVSK